MKKVKSQEEFLLEAEKNAFELLNEDEIVSIDISIEDTKPDLVLHNLKSFDVKDVKALPFGVIKGKTAKKNIPLIKHLEGVEKVEVDTGK